MNAHTLYVVARCLVALMFLMSAIGKASSWQQTLGLMRDHHVPLPQIGLLGSVVLEVVVGTILLALGLFMVPITWILVLYVVAATVSVPVQDIVTNKGRPQGMQLLGSNLAIIGGLIALIACAVAGV